MEGRESEAPGDDAWRVVREVEGHALASENWSEGMHHHYPDTPSVSDESQKRKGEESCDTAQMMRGCPRIAATSSHHAT